MKNSRDFHHLESVIECTRERLHLIYQENGHHTITDEILELSQNLDQLILEHMKRVRT